MTATPIAPFGLNRALLHAPLLWLAILMAIASILAAIGLVVDPRLVTGAPLWAKPLKFSLSIGLYALTLAWLLGMLQRHIRLTWWLGTITAVFLAVEMVVIGGAAALGTTSHFNVSTPLTTTLWSVMAVSVVIVWSAAIFVAILLWRQQLSDRARALAIRAGLVIGVVGMGLAFFMTSPNAEQLSDFQGIAGAHTVGLPDGGEGLPLLGWSTVAGDLRVPHFIGMHALQLLPLSALFLELLGRRFGALRNEAVRLRIVAILTVLYGAITVVLTAQALSGQSIMQPDGVVIAVTSVLLASAATAIAFSLKAQHPVAAH
ncbi:hypothetical protein I6E81_00465 [Salinibacterium sp. NG22]|uniref:hypothetical protein n=1 Tax=Salinibacterium sp. NG22 TaxID=2792040 RepID=UPI0018CCA6D6|nr:hypothetical protein [Salinibacterium sp. NG22]MBH0108635.1 hypothetical protein [Salinibacterium sp. NG22]